ncbi:SUMF1/EgtB/PvdO family nonheme iron enzyme [Henriciella mobilis]|nr:SUMF1/EgtB/PvdO family nonheme iron enzyme [Henriciella mobilis]
MADLFLSYSRADRDRAEVIAKALEAEGFSVWWDKVLKAGQTYDEVTESMLRDSSVVVVLWSNVSVQSKWVRAEATLGQRSSVLVPAMIDDADRPIMFELTQSADLINWSGDREDPRWKTFVADIRSAVDSGASKTATAPAPSPTATPDTDATMETTFWNSIQGGDDAADFEAYLKRYPDGHFSDLARNRLKALSAPAAAATASTAGDADTSPPGEPPAAEQVTASPAASVSEMKKSGSPGLLIGSVAGLAAVIVGGYFAYANLFGTSTDVPAAEAEPQAAGPSRFADCETCPTMVVVPAGAFEIGSPPDEAARVGNEGPQTEITFSEFAIGESEVTHAQWYACVDAGGCSHTPSQRGYGGEDMPVLGISWADAQTYVRWLSEETGRVYRLPSESEWEYAARGGTTTPYWWGSSFDRSIAPTGAPKPASALAPNPFGLKGMLGNAREWVEDCYINTYANIPQDGRPQTNGDCSRRLLRGGSWEEDAGTHRAANRARSRQDTRDGTYSFRVASSATTAN